MAVLGVLTCEILELEFAHILAADPDVARITVLDDAFSVRFVEALRAAGARQIQVVPLLKKFTPSDDALEVVVRVLQISLHSRKRLLQEALVAAAKEMGRSVDALVLGYGLCGNALERPQELLAGAGAPLFIPMDEDHPVDDCVGLLIGGRECYYGEQCRVAGTFFMLPGWTRHWRGIFEGEYKKYPLEMVKRMFDHYERSLLVTNPVMPEQRMRENIEEFTKIFGFRVEVREGTLDILRKTWEEAKAAVRAAE